MGSFVRKPTITTREISGPEGVGAKLAHEPF